MPAIDSYTKLALNFQSKTTGTKEIRDYGATGHIITQVATAQLSTAQTKINSSSLLLDGNSDYVTAPDHADWDLGSGDLTIDFWMYRNSTSQGFVLGQYENSDSFWNILVSGTSIEVGCKINTPPYSFIVQVNASTTLSSGQWYHIAIIRSSGDWNIYLNGTALSLAVETNGTFGTYGDTLHIGAHPTQDTYTSAYLDEVRISNVARWTSNFTPATTPYGSDANTKLLLHMNSYDICSTPKIPTFVGTAQVSTAQYKFGESSLLLDGNSDYITVPDSADWDFGTGDFTIDCWAMFVALPSNGNATICGQNQSDTKWQFYLNDDAGTKTWHIYYTGGSINLSWSPAAALAINTWYHIALVRSGSSWYMWQDGTQCGTTSTEADTMPTLSSVLFLGFDGSAAYFNGYIDGFSISKGVARWTSDFTAPTTPPYLQYYTRTAVALPSNDADLATVFTTEEDYNIKLVDSIRVSQTASSDSAIFQFKDVIPGNNVATLTWTGQTNVAGGDSTIYLQAYNRDTTTWTTIDSDNTIAANTDFTLTGVISSLTNYLDSSGMISCRVYQAVV